jgi:hypothetical protein
MDRRLSEEDLNRLNKLAELRDRGVLSDEEFAKAKARLLDDDHPSALPTGRKGSGAGPNFWRKYWLPLAGVGILILLVAGLFIMGRISSSADETDLNLSASNDMIAGADPRAAEALCGAEQIYHQISDTIFAKAVEQYEGSPDALNNLKKSVAVRVQYPLLRGGDLALGRTDCSGHIILDLPPNVRPAFDGAKTLEADVDFSVQPAADGNGNVVTPDGIERIIQRLVAAASLVESVRDTSPPTVITYNPSFSCSGTLTDVEKLICKDEALSGLDRSLARRYAQLKDQLDADDWQQVVELQRSFLNRRSQCVDVSCLKDAYVGQSRRLDEFAPADAPAPQ